LYSEESKEIKRMIRESFIAGMLMGLALILAILSNQQNFNYIQEKKLIFMIAFFVGFAFSLRLRRATFLRGMLSSVFIVLILMEHQQISNYLKNNLSNPLFGVATLLFIIISLFLLVRKSIV